MTTTADPLEYLKSHYDQFFTQIMLTSQIVVDPDDENEDKVRRLTSQITENLNVAMNLIVEMDQIHMFQLKNAQKREINLIPAKIVTTFEQITNRTQSIKIHLYIVKMLDVIFRNKWYSVADKDSWTLIYLVNYMFDMHDIFSGSFLSLRLVRMSKEILLSMLEARQSTLNQEQSYEINSLLNTEAIQGSKAMIHFENDTKELRLKLQKGELD